MKFLKPAIVLLVVGVIAAAALGFTNEATKDIIEKQRADARNSAMKAIIPEAEAFEQIGETKVYNAKDGAGNIVGGIVFTYPNGFGGPVEVITGVGTDGTVKGVRIGSHTETPDLGSRATEPKFYEQFAGLSTSKDIVVIKVGTPGDNEIAAISGATVTSNGVVEGVKEAIKIFSEAGGTK